MNNLRTSPLSSCKNLPPIFFMVHLLHRLYGVDAPAPRQHNCPTETVVSTDVERESKTGRISDGVARRIGRLSSKPFLIWLLRTPPHLKYVATLLCNLSPMACFLTLMFHKVVWQHKQGSFRAGTHRNAVPVLFLATGTPFRSFSAYSCKI